MGPNHPTVPAGIWIQPAGLLAEAHFTLPCFSLISLFVRFEEKKDLLYEDRNSHGRIILEKGTIMKHVDGVLGWGGESWLYDRDFCKFFFFSFITESVKEHSMILWWIKASKVWLPGTGCMTFHKPHKLPLEITLPNDLNWEHFVLSWVKPYDDLEQFFYYDNLRAQFNLLLRWN